MVEDKLCDDEELFCVSSVKKSPNSQALATCTVNQKHDVVFEIDTGVSCNVLTVLDYVMATGDTVILFVEWKGQKRKVHFML